MITMTIIFFINATPFIAFYPHNKPIFCTPFFWTRPTTPLFISLSKRLCRRNMSTACGHTTRERRIRHVRMGRGRERRSLFVQASAFFFPYFIWCIYHGTCFPYAHSPWWWVSALGDLVFPSAGFNFCLHVF